MRLIQSDAVAGLVETLSLSLALSRSLSLSLALVLGISLALVLGISLALSLARSSVFVSIYNWCFKMYLCEEYLLQYFVQSLFKILGLSLFLSLPPSLSLALALSHFLSLNIFQGYHLIKNKKFTQDVSSQKS